MKKLGTNILVLAIFGGLLWALVAMLRAVLVFFAGAESEVSVAIIAGAATIMVTVVSALLAKWVERRAKLEEEHRSRKIEIYQKLVRFLTSRLIYAEKLGEAGPDEREIARLMAELTPELITWAPPPVIKAFVDFRQGESSSIHILARLEAVLRNIRSDLGHRDLSLQRADLLRLFINDLPDNFAKISH